jgi:hypothetical protein
MFFYQEYQNQDDHSFKKKNTYYKYAYFLSKEKARPAPILTQQGVLIS